MIERGRIAGFTIRLGGQLAPEEFMADLVQVAVDTHLYLPGMFTLRLNDPEFKWVDSDLLRAGTAVQISAKALVSPGGARTVEVALIDGEMTALEPDFSQNGEAELTLRGYDRAYRLHYGRKSRSFLSSTDSEIAGRIARELSLEVQTDSTGVIHDYVFQHNQTDLEFLTQRAQRIGYRVRVDGRTLYFQRAGREVEEGPALTWKINLLSFRPRLTIIDQVSEVTVRGWDPFAKKEIVGRSTDGERPLRLGIRASGGEVAQDVFRAPGRVVLVDHPVASVDEANALAQALFDEIAGEFIQAEGVAIGDPRVRAGAALEIDGLGQRFSGTYYITSATHTLIKGEYQVAFTISGRQPNTVGRLLEGRSTEGHQAELVRGVVIGVVTNTRDPNGLGRIKIRYPWLVDGEESPWVRVSQGGGIVSLPAVNQEVLVAFEHGDIHRPYVLGTLYNGKDRPPASSAKGIGLRSHTGHEIILDDSDDRASITIRDRSGQNEIKIDTIRNDMAIRVKGNLSIEAEGKVEIVSRNSLSIEARGKGEIRANNLTLDGGPKTDVKGGVINLN